MGGLRKILQRLERSGKRLKGVGDTEILEMESVVGLMPDPVKEMFALCGAEHLDLFSGAEFGFKKMPELRENAMWILSLSGKQNILEKDHCVFLTNQGYEFFAAKNIDGKTRIFHFIDGQDGFAIVKLDFVKYIKCEVNLILKYT